MPSSAHHIIYYQILMLLLQNLLRFIQPENWFQHTSKISIKLWCSSQMSKGQRWLVVLLFLVLKFHILIKYPCNIKFCCAIILLVRTTKYQLDFDAIIQYQKDKMSLWSQTSVFRVLSLPFGIRPLPCNSVPKLYETFPTNISRYYTSSPASAYAWVPVPSKDYYLPEYFE